jgi:hypothetical protein
MLLTRRHNIQETLREAENKFELADVVTSSELYMEIHYRAKMCMQYAYITSLLPLHEDQGFQYQRTALHKDQR